jgi:hypothetical protein
VTSLGIDDHVAVRDLALPEGVKVRLPPERTLVAVVKEKLVVEEETAAAAPAAGAPAGASKAPPAPGKGDAAEKK